MGFHETLSGAEPTENGFALDIPGHWQQGRTAYGGFSAALAYAAARRSADDLPPLRSAQISFVGPLSGRVEVQAELLRRGRNASWIDARVANEKGVGLSADMVFMSAMESRIHLNECEAPADMVLPDKATSFENPNAPQFVRNHLEVRFGTPPSQNKRPVLSWWVRLQQREGLDGMTNALLCADGLPPGIMPLLDFSAPVSSMQWQINFLTADPQTRDGWWLLRSEADYAENGCSSQRMMMWNTEGEAIASGTQSVALFG